MSDTVSNKLSSNEISAAIIGADQAGYSQNLENLLAAVSVESAIVNNQLIVGVEQDLRERDLQLKDAKAVLNAIRESRPTSAHSGNENYSEMNFTNSAGEQESIKDWADANKGILLAETDQQGVDQSLENIKSFIERLDSDQQLETEKLQIIIDRRDSLLEQAVNALPKNPNLPNLLSSSGSTTLTSSLAASSIAGTVANQQTTDATAIKPFAAVTINDPNAGRSTETVTVAPSSTANGTLSDPNAATDGSTVNDSAITLTGSASAVTTELDALVFTPTVRQVVPGQSAATTFLISDTNSAELTAAGDTTSVVAAAPPAPTAAQLKQVGADLIQFYKDMLAHKPVTGDTSKLASDFGALNLTQAELGQLLGQTLVAATVGSMAASTLGADIDSRYYSKITSNLAHQGQGLATDLTGMLTATTVAGADDLLQVHNGQNATTALVASVHGLKLG